MNAEHNGENGKIQVGSKPLRNSRHEAFCQYMTGFPPMSAIAAYRKVGYKNAEAHAARLVDNCGISERISFLRAKNDKACQSTKDKALAILSQIAEDEDVKPADRISSIVQLSKMCGWNAVEKVETSGQVAVVVQRVALPDIRKGAASNG